MADIVNTGTAADTGTGDDLRTAFTLINQRFQELLGTLSQITWATGLAIQATPARQWTVVAGQAYVATSNHIAGATFAADLAAGKWLAVDVAQHIADLAAVGAGRGSLLVGHAKAGRTVADALNETPSTEDRDEADALTRINAAIAATSDGKLRIPAGQYSITGDVLIRLKNPGSNTNGEGFFTLEATGARFSGSGRIIIDSCKRVKIIGLDAPDFDICWRGAWWCTLEDVRWRDTLIEDAPGTSFSSTVWNKVIGGQSQVVTIAATAVSYHNAHEWYTHSMRGNIGQGFDEARSHAFRFLGNVNAQSWQFYGGDVSYYTSAVYEIGAGNTTGDIELTFDGAYLDSEYPKPAPRDKARIQTRDCHFANEKPSGTAISAVWRGGHDAYRSDRGVGWQAFSGMNLIPNGDFRVGLPTWSGAGYPVGSTAGAAITEMSGAGFFGRYLNINQATNLGGAGAVYLTTNPLPVAGRVTAYMLIRNAVAGTRSIRVGFGALFETISINNTEPTLFTLTSGDTKAAGTQQSIIIRADDDVSLFNVDVLYCSVAYGEAAPPFVPALAHRELIRDVVYDPPSIAAGAGQSVDFTVPGAAIGDAVIASPGTSIGFLEMSAPVVVSADTVRLRLTNPTGAAIDMASSTWRVRVWKRLYA